MSIAAVLAEFDVTEDDFARELHRVLHSAPAPNAASLTEQERAIRADGGLDMTADPDEAQRQFVLQQQTNIATQVRDSLPVASVAARLGLDASRVRHRVRDGALFGYRVGRSLRLPTWQFTSTGQPLPGLRAVLAALPEGLHPLSVTGFMTTPDPDLGAKQHNTPAAWLAGGGDPERVAEKAAALNAW
jgi:hypothetical protein